MQEFGNMPRAARAPRNRLKNFSDRQEQMGRTAAANAEESSHDLGVRRDESERRGEFQNSRNGAGDVCMWKWVETSFSYKA